MYRVSFAASTLHTKTEVPSSGASVDVSTAVTLKRPASSSIGCCVKTPGVAGTLTEPTAGRES